MEINTDNGIMFHKQWFDKEYCRERVSQICHGIMLTGVCSVTDTVGVAVGRNQDMLLTIMALLKLGITFVPLDPALPKERIEYIADDSGIRLVIEDNDEVFPYLAIQKINIACEYDNNEDRQEITDGESFNDIDEAASDERAAYIMYTSGTTGNPKGVLVRRKGLFNLMQSLPELVGWKKGDSILCVTKETFDIFFVESVIAIHYGLKVILCDEEEMINPKKLESIIRENQVDILQFTPSRLLLLKLYFSSMEFLNNVKILMVGGEAFPDALLQQLNKFEKLKVFNMYGPTETTIWSCISEVTGRREADIGKPVANTQVYLLDDDLNEVSEGEYGEICIGGDGLAKGYQKRNELTEQAFITRNGIRLYRTGDVGIVKKNRLFCCGRIDNQVKYHGVRIELEEIEAHLLKVSQVDMAIAALCKNRIGSNSLTAFYVADNDISYVEFYEQLKETLPSYMMPTYFIRVPFFFCTSSGKADRKRIVNMYYGRENMKI